MIADGPWAKRPPHIALEVPPLASFWSSRSLTIVLPALALLALGGCDRQSDNPAQPQASVAASGPTNGKLDRSHKGSAMPDFTLHDPAGRTLSLASLKGRPVLINLWATWCAPCVKEMPMLEALAASGKVRVVTVSQDMDHLEKVTAFFAEHKFAALQPWLDPDNDLAFHYNGGTLPTSVYYDAQGKEVWRLVGDHDWAGTGTDAMLAEAHAN